MTSRTPIRLTPHRGPLATPSNSPESSPTLSAPPSDFSHCSTAIRPTLDAAILQHRISTLGPPTRHQPQSLLYRWSRKVTKQRPFSRSTYLYPRSLIFESLIYSVCELAKALAGIVTFCLLIWGFLEWPSYVSKLPQQPNAWTSMSRFPLPLSTRVLYCHANHSLCKPRDQHVAVLQFLSEQIQHAKALSSLSVSLGSPLRTFFEAHHAIIPKVTVRHNLPELPHLVQEVDTLANLTELLDPSILDFTSGSFIGRSFALALDELDDIISEATISHGSFSYEEHQDAHLHAIYWRTTSNILLEYSAGRARARRLLQRVHALHQQLSPSVSGLYVVESIERRLSIWWWKGIVRHPTTSTEDRMQAFVTGLEIALDNIHRLIAYLDWITERLAQTTLRDVLKIRRRTDFSSCMASLQELFVQSKPSTSKKRCFRRNDYGVTLPTRLERVDIMVPGSPTVRAGR